MTYAHYKLRTAVETLQSSHMKKRAWLESNDVYHVLHLSIEDIPHDVREDFNLFCSDETILRMRENCLSQLDVVRAMSDQDVERIASRIVELYYHVDAAMFSRAHQLRRPPPLPGTEQTPCDLQ